jgi:hypothetical protein
MSNRLPTYLRDLLKAIIVYAAGAWVAIEVVEFAVRQYGLTQFLVNAAVIIAFGGGMVTAVLVWFHGESGRQKAPPSEIVIIGSIAVATGITLFYLSDSNPLDQFNDLSGYRLILEYRDKDLTSTNGHTFSLVPFEAIHLIEGGDRGIFSLDPPGSGEIRGPIMQAQFDGHPAMFFDSEDSDYAQVTFVLPYEPEDIKRLVSIGRVHQSAAIVTEGLNLQISSGMTITERDDGAVIRVDVEPSDQ